MNESGVVVTGGTMVSPCLPHLLVQNEKMYTTTKAYEEMCIKVIIEDELKGKQWGSLKQTDKAKMTTINAVSTYTILKMHLRRYMSYTASDEKQTARDFLLSFLNNDLLVSNIGANNTSDFDLRIMQVNEAKHKPLRILPGTRQYDMS